MKTYNTPEEVAAALPEGIREKYLANFDPNFKANLFPCTLYYAVCNAFPLCGSDVSYWQEVANRARAGEFDPKGEENTPEPKNEGDLTASGSFAKEYERLAANMVEHLRKMDDKPYASIKGGKSYTAHELANEIESRTEEGVELIIMQLRLAADLFERGKEKLRESDAPAPTLDQIKDEVARVHGYKGWGSVLNYASRREDIDRLHNEVSKIHSAAVSAHERQRAERAEKEVERLKTALEHIVQVSDSPSSLHGETGWFEVWSTANAALAQEGSGDER